MDTNPAPQADKPAEDEKPSAPTPPVMDVQPPQSSPAAQVASPPSVTEGPTDDKPPAAPSLEESPVTADAPSDDSDLETPKENPMAIKALPEHAQHKIPVGVIATIVLVFLALSALSVYAYMQTGKKPAPAADTNQTQQEPTPEKSVSDEINETSQEVDSTTEAMDDETDFNEEDISDTTLGL